MESRTDETILQTATRRTVEQFSLRSIAGRSASALADPTSASDDLFTATMAARFLAATDAGSGISGVVRQDQQQRLDILVDSGPPSAQGISTRIDIPMCHTARLLRAGLAATALLQLRQSVDVRERSSTDIQR